MHLSQMRIKTTKRTVVEHGDVGGTKSMRFIGLGTHETDAVYHRLLQISDHVLCIFPTARAHYPFVYPRPSTVPQYSSQNFKTVPFQVATQQKAAQIIAQQTGQSSPTGLVIVLAAANASPGTGAGLKVLSQFSAAAEAAAAGQQQKGDPNQDATAEEIHRARYQIL